MVDFSEDGQALMSNSKDYEILYWDVVKGKRITNVKEFCDIKWYEKRITPGLSLCTQLASQIIQLTLLICL